MRTAVVVAEHGERRDADIGGSFAGHGESCVEHRLSRQPRHGRTASIRHGDDVRAHGFANTPSFGGEPCCPLAVMLDQPKSAHPYTPFAGAGEHGVPRCAGAGFARPVCFERMVTLQPVPSS